MDYINPKNTEYAAELTMEMVDELSVLDLEPARHPGESYEHYKERQRYNSMFLKRYLKGLPIYINIPQPRIGSTWIDPSLPVEGQLSPRDKELFETGLITLEFKCRPYERKNYS